MTGYGRANVSEKTANINVECKSLNSRYLELTCKLPKLYSSIETELRQLVQTRISRGRVELTVARKVEAGSADPKSVEEQKRKLLNLEEKFIRLGVTIDNDRRYDLARQMLNECEVPSDEELSPQESEAVRKAATEAVTAMIAQRKEEGTRLKSDLETRLVNLVKSSGALEKLSVQVPATLREKCSDRIQSSLKGILEVDPARLLQEVALLVDRSDITEELVRLKAHLDLFSETLSTGGVLGKKLDFICQEIFRELNTLGAKSSSAEIQSRVVDCKVELERMREQVQNLE